MSKSKPNNVVSFQKFARKRKDEDGELVLNLKIYKSEGKLSYYYTMLKGKQQKTDDFIAFSLSYVVREIISYNNDPCDVLELTEEIITRLGYEIDECE